MSDDFESDSLKEHPEVDPELREGPDAHTLFTRLAERAKVAGLTEYASEFQLALASGDYDVRLDAEPPSDVYGKVMNAIDTYFNLASPDGRRGVEATGGDATLLSTRLADGPEAVHTAREALGIVYQLVGVADQRKKATPHVLGGGEWQYEMRTEDDVVLTETSLRRKDGPTTLRCHGHWQSKHRGLSRDR